MERSSIDSEKGLFRSCKEKIFSEGKGIWLGNGCDFTVTGTDKTEIAGILSVKSLSEEFGLNEEKGAMLAKYLISKGYYSLRSRLQQSGLSIVNSQVQEENKVVLSISSLTGKEIANVPPSFELLRFFIDIPARALSGEALYKKMDKILGIPPRFVPEDLVKNDWQATIPWETYRVGVINAKNIDLGKVINSLNREGLHKILEIEWGNLDNLNPKFYLADSSYVKVPDDICLRIVTDPEKAFTESEALPHLNSPIVDPGFEGKIIFEHTRTFREGDINEHNPVAVLLYEV